jgi:hypothetical protein
MMDAIIMWLKDLGELIQVWVVSVGIIVGGVWTYLLHVRKRLTYPRATVDLSISHVPKFTEHSQLVQVTLSIKNSGDVLLKTEYAELRLRKVVPIPEDLHLLADGSCDPVVDGEAKIEWPLVAERKWPSHEHPLEIEPGESDCLYADFVVPADLAVAELYCFVVNSRKKADGLGWTCTRLCSLKDDMEVKEMADNRQRLNEQQRQQRPQKPQQQQQPKPSDERKPKK